MGTGLALYAPLIMWGLVLGLMVWWQYRGSLLVALAVGVNLWAIWTLSHAHAANYFWVVLLCAVGVAIVAVVMVIRRSFDLLLPVYMRLAVRLLMLATTIWWVAAIFFARFG